MSESSETLENLREFLHEPPSSRKKRDDLMARVEAALPEPITDRMTTLLRPYFSADFAD